MQKKIVFIFLVLFLSIFVVSGCILKKEPLVQDEDSWENEVLEAKECGMDGLMCCENDPACYYGQVCCASPDNPKKNYCADSCDFGEENKFCRKDDPKCNSGFICSEDYCVQCGEENELCCSQDICSDDLICYQSHCVKCGLSGNPCCGDICSQDKNRLECNNGICKECGFGGKPKCKEKPFCDIYHLENNGLCLECGKENLPCCLNDKCQSNLKCVKGFCGK